MKSRSRWVNIDRSRTNIRLRLFCFPYAGAGASIYGTWTNRLPVDIEVCPVQLPGREMRRGEESITDFRRMILSLAENLIPFFDTPYTFFGHSMGALLSFELARNLRRVNIHGPERIFVAARRAPHFEDRDPPFHEMDQEQLLREIARYYEPIPDIIVEDPDVLKLVIDTIKADYTVLSTYQYYDDVPLRCPITALGGLSDRSVLESDLDFWKQHSTGPFQKQMFPGNHFFVNTCREQITSFIAQVVSSPDIYLSF